MQITSSGFQFLLLDTASQVWFFILKYLETVTERGLSLVACLTFLFKLSFSTLGKVYLQSLTLILIIYLRQILKFKFWLVSRLTIIMFTWSWRTFTYILGTFCCLFSTGMNRFIMYVIPLSFFFFYFFLYLKLMLSLFVKEGFKYFSLFLHHKALVVWLMQWGYT